MLNCLVGGKGMMLRHKLIIFMFASFGLVALIFVFQKNNFVNIIEQENRAEYIPHKKMIKVFNGGYENSGFINLIDQF